MQSQVSQAVLLAQVSGLERLTGIASPDFLLSEVKRLEASAAGDDALAARLLAVKREANRRAGVVWND